MCHLVLMLQVCRNQGHQDRHDDHRYHHLVECPNQTLPLFDIGGCRVVTWIESDLDSKACAGKQRDHNHVCQVYECSSQD